MGADRSKALAARGCRKALENIKIIPLEKKKKHLRRFHGGHCLPHWGLQSS